MKKNKRMSREESYKDWGRIDEGDLLKVLEWMEKYQMMEKVIDAVKTNEGGCQKVVLGFYNELNGGEPNAATENAIWYYALYD